MGTDVKEFIAKEKAKRNLELSGWYLLDPVTKEVTPTEDMMAAARQMEDKDIHFVADTYLANGLIRVSSIFLHLDHMMWLEDEPILFESMIFSPYEFLDEKQWRYKTWWEAKEHHEEMVRILLKRFGGWLEDTRGRSPEGAKRP